MENVENYVYRNDIEIGRINCEIVFSCNGKILFLPQGNTLKLYNLQKQNSRTTASKASNLYCFRDSRKSISELMIKEIEMRIEYVHSEDFIELILGKNLSFKNIMSEK